MVVQLEKERETRHALQEQCAFLGQEVFKLETEMKHLKLLSKEQRNKILERGGGGSHASQSYNDFSSLQNGNGSTSMNNFTPGKDDASQVSFCFLFYILTSSISISYIFHSLFHLHVNLRVRGLFSIINTLLFPLIPQVLRFACSSKFLHLKTKTYAKSIS
jgi:hypothetical protein